MEKFFCSDLEVIQLNYAYFWLNHHIGVGTKAFSHWQH